MVTRVLFVGSYDIAGSGIATRLYREGCRISWLTTDQDQMLWGSKVHGNIFRSAVTYNRCSQILKGESIDCIVVLTGTHREAFQERFGREQGKLLSMLSPLLRAAAAEKVSRICFLSSVCLEQQELLISGLEELRAAERITTSFCKQQNILLLTLRLGCVYGEGMMDGNCFLGDVLHEMRRGKDVFCPFTADSVLDFLCVPDVADAVYRLLNMDAAGTFDISTGSPVTTQKLYEVVAEAAAFQGQIQFGHQNQCCWCGDGHAIRQICGWMPFYPFAEHGPNAVKQELERCQKAVDNARKKSRFNKIVQRRSFLYETAQNLLLFAIAVLMSNFATDWSDLRYVDVRLLYVIIVAITFGMRQGLLATGLATVSYIISLLYSGIDTSYVLYSIESWIPFVIYGVAGAFGGYWSDKKQDEYENLENEFGEQKDRYQLLQDLYREVLDVKNQLQKQIVISKDSFNRIYAITEDLDSQNPRIVLIRTVRVIEEIMEGGAVAIYLRPHADNRYGRLMACSDTLSSKLLPSLDFQAMPKLQEAMESGDMYINKELDPQYPAFAMPVSDGKVSIALVELYDLSLNQYTVYYKNLFQTLVQIVQRNLIHAYSYQEENRDKIYLPGTSIMTVEEFNKERKTLKIASEKYGYPSSIASILCNTEIPSISEKLEAFRAKGQKNEKLYEQLAAWNWNAPDKRNLSPVALSSQVEPLLRGTDLLGMGQDGKIRAAFLYLDRTHRPVLERRFAQHGFRLVWED